MPDNTITTFGSVPYVDDFHLVDPKTEKTVEEKNYLRILYKPGVSVQTRELNQMQSILQAQIDKFGRGVFNDGSAIIEGEVNFDNDIHVVDVTFTTSAIAANIDQYTEIKNSDGLAASVIKYEFISDTKYRLFIRYENSTQGEDKNNVNEFVENQSFQSNLFIVDVTDPTIDLGIINSISYAALAKVESGVYFTRGEFVLSEEQTLYLIKPSKDYLISGRVAFEVEEGVIGSNKDATLLDNASGEPNYAAPGADRYFINLNLKFVSDYDLDPNGDDHKFIENNDDVTTTDTSVDDIGLNNDLGVDTLMEFTDLLSIVNNNVQETTTDLLADNLTNILAKRTSEESGDYAIDPFVIDIRDYYNDTTNVENRGLYTEEQIRSLGIVVGDDDISGISSGVALNTSATAEEIEDYGKSRFVIGVEPSIAYVDGYRIESESRIDIPVERARTTENNTVYTTARLGNYILLDETGLGYLPNFGDSITFQSGTTAKIRNIEFVNDNYRLYLYDISGSIEDNDDPVLDSDTSIVFNRVADSGLLNTEFNRSIYELPYDNISNIDSIEFIVRERNEGALQVQTDNTIEIQRSGGVFFDENSDSYIVFKGDTRVTITDLEFGPNNNNSVILTLDGNDVSEGDSVDAIFSYRNTLSRITKSSEPASKIVETTTFDISGPIIDLEYVDVYKINSILYTPASEQSNTDYVPVDISEQFVFDDGQRDGVYKKSKLTWIGSSIAAGEITISYNYFERSSIGGYYSKESYAIDYENIPSYQGVRLSDVLDFRPDEDSDYNTATLDPNSVIEASISYYLNRIDKVVVNNLGDFKVISGIPSLNPEEPETPDNAMHLYSVDVPAYTFDVRDVESRYVDNRRYTMRDIGELEDRVKNLEYYTSLSLLEKEASTKQVFDKEGVNPFERFKNGILVDNFVNHSVGRVEDPGYLCSIDGEDGILRPSFDQKSTRFKLDSNIITYGSFSTLDYSEEVPFIDQPSASIDMSVNPYAVAAWWGELKLSPSSDEWKETSQRPDVVVNRENDADVLRKIVDASRAQGTIWKSWKTSWTGRSRRRVVRRGGRRRLIETSQTELQTRRGIRTSMSVEKVRNVVNEKVVDTSFVPFIRSRKIYFSGKMFRPNTRLYIYFDNENISDYAVALGEGQFVEYKDSDDSTVYDVGADAQATQTTNGNAESLITDENGSIEGYFVIPNNAALKFRTGEREVVFTDSKINNDTEASTSAKVIYSAKGVMQHKQRTVVSTRKVRITRERVVSKRNLRRTRRRWRDPLAQSFMIGEIDSGIFATSLDLYFSKKSVNVPVQMYLVTMDNGYPTQEVIPNSEVTLLPEDVYLPNVDGTPIKTNFKFETPVYLEPGVEYAIVVLSNDDAYRMFLSEIGKEDVITKKPIVKNPYTGVMFKSQNASTWTADQNKDFKFTFYRAKYNANTSKELVFNTLGVSEENPLDFSQLNVISEFINLPQTSIKYQISLDGNDQNSTFYNITPSEDVYLSTQSETPIISNDDVVLKVTLESESEYVTPVVDLDRISLVSIKNYINSESDVVEDSADTELDSKHGNALARYITNEVELNNPADQLNVYLNINRPINDSDVKIYARFKTGDETLDNVNFEQVEADSVIPISSTPFDYNEVSYSINKDGEYFTGFQVKIVILSNEHQNVPSVQDLRVIATT